MRTVLAAGVLVLALAACGDGETAGDGPRIVVTTSILGDVVASLVGDDASIEVVMPAGVDPHDFSPSARQAAALRSAEVVVANGLGFEAGLDDALTAAAGDGAAVLTVTDYVETVPFGEATGGEVPPGELDDDHDDHDHEGDDPHVFTDPARMAVIARSLADDLAAAIPALATPAADERADAYVAALEALDEEVASILVAVPPERRVLVTNHEVFGYFAARYGFDVLGAVIPGGSTLAEPSAADLAGLAEQIADAGVPAIFVETSAPRRVADALAAEGRDVEIVELYTESLGEAGSDGATYPDMMRTNARRIAEALG